MALSINDVIALANAGFTKTDIAAFMNLGNPQTTPLCWCSNTSAPR